MANTIRDYIMGRGNAPMPPGLESADPVSSLNKNVDALNKTLNSTKNTLKDLEKGIKNLLGNTKSSDKQDPMKGKELVPLRDIERQVKDIHSKFPVVVTGIKEISQNTKITSKNLSGILQAIVSLSKETKKRYQEEDARFADYAKAEKIHYANIERDPDRNRSSLDKLRLEKEEVKLRRDVEYYQKSEQKLKDELAKYKANESRETRQNVYTGILNALGMNSGAKLIDRLYGWEKSRAEKAEALKDKESGISDKGNRIKQLQEDLKRTQDTLEMLKKQQDAFRNSPQSPSSPSAGGARDYFSSGSPSPGKSDPKSKYTYRGNIGVTKSSPEFGMLAYVAPKIDNISENTSKILKILTTQQNDEGITKQQLFQKLDRQTNILEEVDDALENPKITTEKKEEKKESKGLFQSLLDSGKGIFNLLSNVPWAGLGQLAIIAGELKIVSDLVRDILNLTDDTNKAREDIDRATTAQNQQIAEAIKKMHAETDPAKKAKMRESINKMRSGRDETSKQFLSNDMERWGDAKKNFSISDPSSWLEMLQSGANVAPEVLNLGSGLNGPAAGTALMGSAAALGTGSGRSAIRGVWDYFTKAPKVDQLARFNELSGNAPAATQPGMLSRSFDWMKGKAGSAKDFLKGGIDDIMTKFSPSKMTKYFSELGEKGLGTLSKYTGKISGMLKGVMGKVAGGLGGLSLKALGKGIAKFIPFLNAGIVTNEIMTRLGAGDYLGAAVASTGYLGLLGTAAGMATNAVLDWRKVKNETENRKSAEAAQLNDSDKDAKIRARLEELKGANPGKSMAELKQMLIQEGTISGALTGREKMSQIKALQAQGKSYAEAKAIVEAQNPPGKVMAEAIPGRASGGPVQAGKPFLVGEGGPELFVPNTSGNILPNSGSGFSEKFDAFIIQNGYGAKSKLVGAGYMIEAAASKYGIDPELLAAITIHESGWGTSKNIVNNNNPSGSMDPKTKWQKPIKFNSLMEGFEYTARNLKNNYFDQGLTSISAIGKKYAPAKANNDPNNLNRHWAGGVSKLYGQMGGSSTGLSSGGISASAGGYFPSSGGTSSVVSGGNVSTPAGSYSLNEDMDPTAGALTGREKMSQIKALQAQGKTFAEAKAIVEAQNKTPAEAIPGRASGGPVTAGKPYKVGEKGVELFVPNASGEIIPNNLLPTGADVGRTNAAIKNFQKWNWGEKGGSSHPGYLASKRIPPVTQRIIDEFYFTGYTPGKGDLRMQGSGVATSIGDTPKTVEGYLANKYKYVTAAVDPRVLPYGTVFAIDSLPGVPLIAADTGSAIQGTHLDVAFSEMSNARKFTTPSGVVTKIGKVDLSKISHKGMRGKLESLSLPSLDHALLNQQISSVQPSSLGIMPSFQVATPAGGGTSNPVISGGNVSTPAGSYSLNEDMDPTAGATGLAGGVSGSAKIVPPLPTIITSEFGMRNTGLRGASKNHRGIDFRAGMGTPVHAMMDGVVREPHGGSNGIVSIQHENGLISQYLHLSDWNIVKPGMQVTAGQIIGKSGKTTGSVSGMSPHLHFALVKNGQRIDPLAFLKQNIPGYNPGIKGKSGGSAGLTSGINGSAGIDPTPPSSGSSGFGKFAEKVASLTSTGITAASDFSDYVMGPEIAKDLGFIGKNILNPDFSGKVSSHEELMANLAHPEFAMTGAEVAKAKLNAGKMKAPTGAPVTAFKPPAPPPPAPAPSPAPVSASAGNSGGGGTDPHIQDVFLSLLNSFTEFSG